MLFNLETIQRDVLALHASAACNDDGVLLFLGPSGTGKSTMLRLLSPYMEKLAEDKVYVVPQPDGGWKVIKGDEHFPMRLAASFREGLATAPSAPLRAIFRLYQAFEPKLERVDALTQCRYLTNACFEISLWLDDACAARQPVFVTLAQIARDIPGYVFHFDLSSRTPDVLRRRSIFSKI